MQHYRRLLRYARPHWLRLLAIVAFTVANAGVIALQPWPLKWLVDYALKETPDNAVTLIIWAALASLGLFVLSSALDAGITLVWTGAGQRMVYGLAGDIYRRLIRLSFIQQARRPVGESLSRVVDDSWCVYTVTDALLISPGQQLLMLATVGFVAWRLDPALAAMALVMTPFLGGAAFYFGNRLKRRSRLQREAQSRLTSFVQQTLSAIPLVQAFDTESRNRQQFNLLAEDTMASVQRGAFLRNAYALMTGLITTTGLALVLYAGGRRVLSGELSLGSLLVFLAYLQSLQNAARGLLGTHGNLKSAEASIDRALEILDAPDAIRESPDAKGLPARPHGHIRLENVTTGYEPDRPVLQDINLDVAPGETVALVGATGAGKTTLASLVPRFLDPWQGRVTFDGVDLRDLRLDKLRAQVSFVLQEPFLLPVSVVDNIAYGRAEATRKQIVAASVAANADEFIHQLPQGYDTVIGERGATLSGGQRQRLAIARALIKDAPVLILDEPTAAIDAQTESQLMEALARLVKGRTTFIIAHRLATVRLADRIIVLEGGRIVEQGTHQTLLAANGIYRRLHDLQTSEAAA